MNIDVSFVAGVPVLKLEGRFDGAGAVAFDDRAGALDACSAALICRSILQLEATA